MEKFRYITKKNFTELPQTSGVYNFWHGKELVYIGKAIDLRSRIKNHFFQPSYRDNLFISKVNKIGFFETHSEIEALVLEASLIKKHLPKFNVVWKDGKNYFYVAIAQNAQKLPYVVITHQKNDYHAQYIGPFVEGNALKKTLKYLRRAFPYYTSKSHPKNKCTWCHLNLCPGSNPEVTHYKKNIKKLMLILKGQRNTVSNSLKKEMVMLAKQHKFEEAGKVRDQLYALQQVMSHTGVIEQRKLMDNNWSETAKTMQKLLKVKRPITKIECYDISNIQGKQAVGSMVVFTEGSPDKSQYKKFKIRMENTPNDIAMLKEVLGRRLAHPEWTYPEVMLIDGGIAQLNVAIKAKNLFKKAQGVKIISIAKGKRELFIEGPASAKGSDGHSKAKIIPLKNLPQAIYNAIVYLDDEAHRFAINYHRRLRSKKILK